MFIVRFKRKDNATEEYFYHKYPDAEYHFSLFIEDDSDIYSRIELLNEENLLEFISII